jgi:capsule polysaccharide export protein KpsE/RkpR
MPIYDKETLTLDTYEIIKLVWRKKIKFSMIIIIIAFLFAFGSLFISNKYTSTALYKIQEDSTSQSSSFGLSSVLPFAGGISIGGNSQKADLIKEIIRSRNFYVSLISNDEIKLNLIAAESYDYWNGTLKISNNVVERQEDLKWKKYLDQNGNLSIEQTYYDFYLKNLFIDHDDKTGFITISFTHLSPKFAQEMVNVIVKKADSIVRERDLQKSKESILYLEEQLRTTTQTEIRTQISMLLKNEINKSKLAFISEHYYLDPIDKANLPEKKSSPNRPVIAIFGFIFGFIFSLLYLIFTDIRAKKY